MVFRDDPVWRHHRPATQEKSDRGRMLFWVKLKHHPARVPHCVATLFSLLPHTFQPLHCLNILTDRVECRLQTRRAIFLLFCPFLLDSPAHLTAKSSTSDTKLTLTWSISPKIVTTQINLGLNPRYLVGIYPPTLFFVTNPDLDSYISFSEGSFEIDISIRISIFFG